MISCSNKGKNKITCVDVNARAWRVCRTRVVHNFPCLGNGVVRNFIPRTFLFLSISNLFCHFDAFHLFFILPPFISRFFFIFFPGLFNPFSIIFCAFGSPSFLDHLFPWNLFISKPSPYPSAFTLDAMSLVVAGVKVTFSPGNTSKMNLFRQRDRIYVERNTAKVATATASQAQKN